MYWQ